MAIKKMCPRCRVVIDVNDRYCNKCTARINKDYDHTMRNKKGSAFYGSKAWRTIRQEIMNKYHGLDLYELKVHGKIRYAETVHHIDELDECPDRALDRLNLIPLTNRNHAKIHSVYNTDQKDALKNLLFELVKG